MQQDFPGKTISVEDLQRKYQQINPEKTWLDTVKGLATEEPQLSPLYFILARFWVSFSARKWRLSEVFQLGLVC
jgi:uncharacterized membrane protein